MYTLTAVALFALLQTAAHAQADTINTPAHPLVTSQLRTGLKQYLVYYQDPAKTTSMRFWFWLRRIEPVEQNGEALLRTTQQWYGADTIQYRTCYSLNRKSNFAPLYHSETIAGKTNAYNWSDTQITGADSIADNKAKAFKLDFNYPTLNWNLDIETFEMLPLAAGKSFLIPFYDAGLQPPMYILYTVTGSEVLDTYDNHKVDCWILLTKGEQPNHDTFTQTFWISKKGHEFLKEEDHYSGKYRYKVKVPALATDIAPRFNK